MIKISQHWRYIFDHNLMPRWFLLLHYYEEICHDIFQQVCLSLMQVVCNCCSMKKNFLLVLYIPNTLKNTIRKKGFRRKKLRQISSFLLVCKEKEAPWYTIFASGCIPALSFCSSDEATKETSYLSGYVRNLFHFCQYEMLTLANGPVDEVQTPKHRLIFSYFEIQVVRRHATNKLGTDRELLLECILSILNEIVW